MGGKGQNTDRLVANRTLAKQSPCAKRQFSALSTRPRALLLTSLQEQRASSSAVEERRGDIEGAKIAPFSSMALRQKLNFQKSDDFCDKINFRLGSRFTISLLNPKIPKSALRKGERTGLSQLSLITTGMGASGAPPITSAPRFLHIWTPLAQL